MKNFFKKIKSYSFWVALSSALVVFLNALGRMCGFSISNKIVEDVVMGIAGVLVVLGVVNMNTNKEQNSGETPNDSAQPENEESKGEIEDSKPENAQPQHENFDENSPVETPAKIAEEKSEKQENCEEKNA